MKDYSSTRHRIRSKNRATGKIMGILGGLLAVALVSGAVFGFGWVVLTGLEKQEKYHCYNLVQLAKTIDDRVFFITQGEKETCATYGITINANIK